MDAHALLAQVPPISLIPTLCVIEDELDLRELLVEFLQFNGYDCWSTASVEGFLEQWPHTATNLAIVDLNLLGSSGLDIVRLLQPRNDVGVIVLTARQETMIEKECLQAGADHYLRKPVQPDMLLAMIETLWQRMRAGSSSKPVEAHRCWSLAPGRLKIGVHIEVRLTPEEETLLGELIRQPNHTVSIIDLQNSVNAITQQPVPEPVSVLLNRLRYRVQQAGQNFQVRTVQDQGLMYSENRLQ
jgi:DNA-binding response OmpR family regulator